jgi:hypothetical protein
LRSCRRLRRRSGRRGRPSRPGGLGVTRPGRLRVWLGHTWFDRTWSLRPWPGRRRRCCIGVGRTRLLQRWQRHPRSSRAGVNDGEAGDRPQDVHRQPEAPGRAVLAFQHEEALAAQGAERVAGGAGIHAETVGQLPGRRAGLPRVSTGHRPGPFVSNLCPPTLPGGCDENPDRLVAPLLTSTFFECRRGDSAQNPPLGAILRNGALSRRTAMGTGFCGLKDAHPRWCQGSYRRSEFEIWS